MPYEATYIKIERDVLIKLVAVHQGAVGKKMLFVAVGSELFSSFFDYATISNKRFLDI